MMGSLKEACTKLTIWREMAQWPVSDPDLKDQSLTPRGGGRISQWMAFSLLTQEPRVRFLALRYIDSAAA